MNIPEQNEARTAERRPAMAPSTLRTRGLAATDVTVVDLSMTGIRIVTTSMLAVGEEISIGLAGVGARRAYVAWRRDGHYGCAFEEPLEPHEMHQAFTSASVVRLGTPNEVARAAQSGANAALHGLYGAHSLWRLPWDALLFLGGYGLLFGWLAWRFLLR